MSNRLPEVIDPVGLSSRHDVVVQAARTSGDAASYSIKPSVAMLPPRELPRFSTPTVTKARLRLATAPSSRSRSRGPSMDLVLRVPRNLRKKSFFAPTEPRRRASRTFFTTTKRGCLSGGISRCSRNRSEARNSPRTTSRRHSLCIRRNQNRRSRLNPPLPQSVSRTCWWAHWLRRSPRVQAERLCDRHPPAIPPDCAPETRPETRSRDL